MNKIIVASHNQGKIDEIKKILMPFYRQVYSLKDLRINVHVEEDGNTFEENAIKKAAEIMKMTGETVLADDSGLQVDALDGQPGVYSARFAGETATDEENNRKLLRLMESVPAERRQARFRCCIALAFPDGHTLIAEGSCEGVIGYKVRGDKGFGYDPLFIVPEYGLTFAELPMETKNEISHRARALKRLQHILGE